MFPRPSLGDSAIFQARLGVGSRKRQGIQGKRWRQEGNAKKGTEGRRGNRRGKQEGKANKGKRKEEAGRRREGKGREGKGRIFSDVPGGASRLVPQDKHRKQSKASHRQHS